MRAFLVTGILVSAAYARRVQPTSSEAKSLASVLLALQPVHSNRVRAVHMLEKTGPDGIWDLASKTRVFEAWDPEKPRTYENFNPFERNNESAMCDTNGCFPGQSRGYKSPNRPDQSWDIMQKEKALMDELAKDPKFNVTGKPG